MKLGILLFERFNSMNKYKELTKYLTIIDNDNFVQLVTNKEKTIIKNFVNDIYYFIDNNKEDNLNDYISILGNNGILWSFNDMKNADISKLDGICIVSLLIGVVRLDRFYEGALFEFFTNGQITKWLKRLKEIDY